MSKADDSASREAARRIIEHTTTDDHDSDSRAIVELFYSLVTLLPATELGTEVLSRARHTTVARAAPSPRGAQPSPSPPDASRLSRLARLTGRPLPAHIALALALVFTTTLLLLPRGRFEPSAALYLRGTGAARDARGVALLGDDELLIFASGLSELERGYRYVAWNVQGGIYGRLGTMTTIGGDRARLQTLADTLPDQLEVTIEPSTATGAPSGPTVLAGFRPDA
ncbi:MAG: hypothetical protein ACOC2Q_02945 [Spirochaetota bacterium]